MKAKNWHLFTVDADNNKLAKSVGSEYYVVGLFMAPYRLNDKGVNLCPFATTGPNGCVEPCLNTAGNPAYAQGKASARLRKANEFLADRGAFIDKLSSEIAWHEAKASRLGKRLVVRLNGTTDIDYPDSLFLSFPSVQFYDYTKSPYRMRRHVVGDLPTNYHVIFSFSGENAEQCRLFLSQGGNVAVVFASDKFPDTWQGYKVISGDDTDLRFLDPSGSVIGLKAKGKARRAPIGGFIQIDARRAA